MNFRRRKYPEVLENLLTTITHGVAAEAHPFPPGGTNGAPARHTLQREPASEIISIHGTKGGQSHRFRGDTDYKLIDEKTVEWQPGQDSPDAGTLIHINYSTKSDAAEVTDIQTGSVVRTVCESLAFEIARVYAQMDAVYRSAFVDLAEGRSLDNVVAVLGIQRVLSGRPSGELAFTRASGSRGVITIPAGTRVITPDGSIEYETTESVTLAERQNTVRVVARDVEANDPLPAESLTVIPVPIAGVASVTNPGPTSLSAQDETDAQLRERARNFLHGSERATLGAMHHAMRRQGITAEIQENPSQPGLIEITPHAESMSPELQQRLLAAINDSRPAGVKVVLKGVQIPRRLNLELRITTSDALLQQDLRAAQVAVRAGIEDYFRALPLKEKGSISRLVGAVMNVPEVNDVRLISATMADTQENVLDRDNGTLEIDGFASQLGDLRIADPNLPTQLNVVVSFPRNEAPPDSSTIEAELANTLAYLNEINAVELAPAAPSAEQQRRSISYSKLLFAVTLPNKPGESLEQFDTAALTGAAPPLPDETAIAPYRLEFILTSEAGLSRLLTQAADRPYDLTAFERVSLAGVEVEAENEND